MKSEINSETKANFFALYLNQDVLANTKGTHFPIVKLSKNWNWNHPDFYLSLKPLRSISDEDALELSITLGCNDRNPVEFKILLAKMKVKNDSWNLTQFQADFLRSRGYALHWMGLSIDEMISAGWIKLVES